MKRFVFALFTLVFAGSSALASGLIEESLTLPASFPDLFGTHIDNLDALVVRPDDTARHPLAIINHGTPRDATERRHMFPKQMRAQAREFARRGWVAVVFMRRGYGKSEGSYAESSGSCSTANYEPSGRASAVDVREVIRLMTEKPYVEGAKVISVGRSAGGFASVALTSDPPPGLVAAISFAGGRGSAAPDMVCNEAGLIGTFGDFGTTSRIPMLWVYAENDHFFSPALAKSFYAAFTAAGGKAEFIAAPAFEADGHTLFSRAGTPIWAPYVDAFLEKQNLKLTDQPTALDDEAGMHYPDGLSERGKAAYLDFLDAEGHKAFAKDGDGHFGWRGGRDSVQSAVDQATTLCKQKTDQPCHIVMVDDKETP
jgi:dienelactone hydrolase